MGQASRRGTFEERKAQAIKREQDRIAAEEAKRRLRYQQERGAYSVMTWWQIEMSEKRHERICRKKIQSQMAWAQLMGMVHGMGWNSMSGWL